MSNLNTHVTALLNRLIADAEELGLQVAAYLDGELVVDAWAGLADEESGRRVDGETLFTGFSTSKGLTATCVHILAERGLIDYDQPIASYWPEFAAHGKAEVTVRHALTHRAGIPQDPPGFDLAMAADWHAVCRATAEMQPLWEPGSRTVYHALTYGWMLGEVLRRVDGRSISQFLQDEICRPLQIDDLYFGVLQEQENRVATLKNSPGLAELDLPLTPSLADPAGAFNLPKVRRAVIPGAGALVNARSLARHYAMLAGEGLLDGVRLLRPERVVLIATPQYEAPSSGLGADALWFSRHGLGYTLGGGPGPMEGRPRAFGYEGLGTIGFADPSRRFAFAFLKNLLDWSANEMSSAIKVTRAVEAALGIA